MIAKPLALITATVVAIAVSTAASESPVREVMNFDFAWRFRNFDVNDKRLSRLFWHVYKNGGHQLREESERVCA